MITDPSYIYTSAKNSKDWIVSNLRMLIIERLVSFQLQDLEKNILPSLIDVRHQNVLERFCLDTELPLTLDEHIQHIKRRTNYQAAISAVAACNNRLYRTAWEWLVLIVKWDWYSHWILYAMTDRTCTWNFPSSDRKLSTLWGIFLSGESCLVLSTGISRSATTPHEGNRRGSPSRDRGSTNPSSCLTESLDAGHYVGLLIRQCSLRVTVS